jgi:hypothetical protein
VDLGVWLYAPCNARIQVDSLRLTDLPTFQAKFNARTGQFAPMSSRTPGHLSEFERAKRMSEFYFDVNKWEEDLAKRGGRLMGEEGEQEDDGTGKKRKRPTKKDLVSPSIPSAFQRVSDPFAGALQGAEEGKEGREDCVVAHLSR